MAGEAVLRTERIGEDGGSSKLEDGQREISVNSQ